MYPRNKEYHLQTTSKSQENVIGDAFSVLYGKTGSVQPSLEHTEGNPPLIFYRYSTFM